MIVKDKLYIGGQLGRTEHCGHGRRDRRGDRGGVGAGTRRARPDMDLAVAAAREAFDTGPWPRMTPGERADVMAKLSAAHSGAGTRRSPRPSARRTGRRSRSRSWARSSPRPWSSTTTPSWPVTSRSRSPARGCSARSSSAASRSGWWPPSCRGTCRCSSPCSSWRRRWPPGCTVVLKPAPETPLDAYQLAECLERPACPRASSTSYGRPGGRRVPGHPSRHRQGVVHRQHGRRPPDRLALRRALRRCTLELGGKSAADHPRRRRPRRPPSPGCTSRRR